MLVCTLLVSTALATSPLTMPGSMISLDGQGTPVHWSDGDSFNTIAEDTGARLAGYNTLESYGPVHQWGEWSAEGLYSIARAATTVARRRPWKCTTLPGSGGYGRIVVDCPELRDALLRAGLAHTFSVDGSASEADRAAQEEAIAAKRGMWEKGVPSGLVTSLHSADERQDATAYDRVCDPKTGHAPKREHSETYTTCQNVCHDGSCMVYVPYKKRYGQGRAPCLSGGSSPTPAPASDAK